MKSRRVDEELRAGHDRYLSNFTNKGEQRCFIQSRVWNPTTTATTASLSQTLNIKGLQNALSRTSIRRSRIDTLCVASKHSINAFLVNTQLRECFTRNLVPITCIRVCPRGRRRRRAKNNTFKSERFDCGTHCETKIVQEMKGETSDCREQTHETF